MRLHPCDFVDLAPLIQDTFSSLHNKTVLITGSTGLIGGYLLDCILHVAKCTQPSLDLILTTRNPNYIINDIPSNVSVHYAFVDFAEPASLNLLVEAYESSVDIVFHCASPASPKAYSAQPFSTFASNTLGLQYLCLTLKKQDSYLKSKFFFFSTTGVYGKHPSSHYPLHETTQSFLSPTDPKSIYVVSKIAGEQLLSHASCLHSFTSYILRLNINYGPGIDLTDGRALSDFLNDARSGRDIQLRTPGTQKRNYLYLVDAVRAIFMLLNKVHLPCTVNLSHHEDTTVLELASLISTLYGVNVKVPEYSLAHSGIDYDQTSVDCENLCSLTGWSPKVDLRTGLGRLAFSLDSE